LTAGVASDIASTVDGSVVVIVFLADEVEAPEDFFCRLRLFVFPLGAERFAFLDFEAFALGLAMGFFAAGCVGISAASVCSGSLGTGSGRGTK